VTYRWALRSSVLAVLLIGCGPAAGPAVESVPDSHVTIRVSVERASDGATTLVATFEPTESGVHLYGMEMPDGGIDGAGRPTRVVIDDPAWTTTGGPTVSVSSTLRDIAGFDRPFPIYPDGPVTVRVPIQPTNAQDVAASVRAHVTFMACSSSGFCFVPVESHEVIAPVS
jgi:hypothetical protein